MPFLYHFTAKFIFILKFYSLILHVHSSVVNIFCAQLVNCTIKNNPVLSKLAEFISPYNLFIVPKTGSPKRKSSKMGFVLVTVHAGTIYC